MMKMSQACAVTNDEEISRHVTASHFITPWRLRGPTESLLAKQTMALPGGLEVTRVHSRLRLQLIDCPNYTYAPVKRRRRADKMRMRSKPSVIIAI